MKPHRLVLAYLAASIIVPTGAFSASASPDNPSPCQVTTDAMIEATITTAEADGELWEYEGHSGGEAKLSVHYLLSPMGNMSGSFLLDPGAINFALCVADAAKFYSLPAYLAPKSNAIPLHSPRLRIK